MASEKQLNLGQTQILIGKEVVVGTSHECSIFSHELQKSQRLARVWGEAHNVQKSLDYCWRLICQQFLFMTPSYYMASCYDFFVIVAQCQSLSHVRFFATPRTVDLQAPLSMEFSSQEYQSGLPCPSPRDLPDPGIELGSPALQADILLSEPPGKAMTLNHSKYTLSYSASQCLKVSSSDLQNGGEALTQFHTEAACHSELTALALLSYRDLSFLADII